MNGLQQQSGTSFSNIKGGGIAVPNAVYKIGELKDIQGKVYFTIYVYKDGATADAKGPYLFKWNCGDMPEDKYTTAILNEVNNNLKKVIYSWLKTDKPENDYIYFDELEDRS